MGELAPSETCPGCGGQFVPQSGPVHSYMTSSSACWAAFGRVLAAEYANPHLMPVHRLSVDAFAVQHVGNDSRKAVQSVGLHLARLYTQLERGLDHDRANEFMLRAGKRKADLARLEPPSSFTVTVSRVEPFAGTAAHLTAVQDWAQTAWNDWAHVHAYVRRWADAIPV
jgi:hypothetical protein